MYRLLLSIVAVIGFTTPSFSQAPEKPKGRKIAFLVTVSDYGLSGLSSLKRAETESQLLATAFEVSGYESKDIVRVPELNSVTTKRLESRPDANGILEQLEQTCKSLTADDKFLFVFNGHCGKVQKFKDKGLMLFPQEVRLSSEDSMIPLMQIYKILGECKAKQKVILLSPCRTDIVENEASRERLGSLLCPTLPDPPKSVVLVSSCGPFEQSPVTKTGNNPFFVKLASLLSHRSADKPNLTGADIIKALKPQIPANDVADFVKGDLNAFESWDFADRVNQSLVEWADYAGTSRRIFFEKNEPVAALVEVDSVARKTTYAIKAPMTKDVVVSEIEGQTTSESGGLSNTGKMAYVVTSRPNVVIIDAKTGDTILSFEHPVARLSIRPGEITKCCFSPNDEFFLSCDLHGNAILWNLKRKEQAFLIKHKSEVTEACFLYGGHSFVTVTNKGLAQAWSTTTGRNLWELQLPTGVYSLAPSPDGVSIAFGCKAGHLILCDAVTGEKKRSHKFDKRDAWFVRFSPDGKQLLMTGTGDSAMIWDIEPDHFSQYKHDFRPEAAAYSIDGTLLATGDRGGFLKIWNIKSGEMLKTIEIDSWITHVAFSPDSKKLVVIARDSEVRVWDIATGKRLDKK